MSVPSVCRDRRGGSVDRCRRFTVDSQGTGTTTEDAIFPVIFVIGPTKTNRIGNQPSERVVPDEANRTDSSPAESGGSTCPASERCVVGSRYIIAKRCVVGSHLALFGTPLVIEPSLDQLSGDAGLPLAEGYDCGGPVCTPQRCSLVPTKGQGEAGILTRY